MRHQKPIQPFTAVLADELLPEPVRPVAQAWRDLDAEEAHAEDTWRAARAKLAAAQDADRAAAIEAVEKGKPAPVPSNGRELQARADIDAHDARLYEVRNRKKRAGKALLAALDAHRDELQATAIEVATKAADDYAGELDRAQRAIAQAAARLAMASEPLGVLGELDRDRHRHQIGTPSWPLADVDLTAARRDLQRIREAVAHLTPKADASV